MKVLFVDLLLKYINPTRSLIPQLFSTMETRFFGPGYVSSDCLSAGLASFIEKNGPFDVVVVSEHIAFSKINNFVNTYQAFRKNYAIEFPKTELRETEKLFEAVKKLNICKVIITLESDYYNFTPGHISVVDNYFDFVIGWGEQFVSPLENNSEGSVDGFVISANDNWYEFSRRAAFKIIPLAHFVSENEFDYTAISNREVDFCVPGAKYVARKEARVKLLLEKCSVVKNRSWLFIKAIRAIGFKPFSWHWFIAHYNKCFRDDIRRSRITYTCGSTLAYPVRKYFEIPALGSVLICKPCNGFEALGFKDGINAVACEPKDLPGAGLCLLKDELRAQKIADAGRQLVATRHTVKIRANQLEKALISALEGRWAGALWRNGNMEALPMSAVQQGIYDKLNK